MDNIWREMAEKMMAKDPSLFDRDVSPEDIAAAMSDAWGKDRAAAVWTVDDILDAAEYYEVEMTVDEARGVMHELVGHLESYDGGEVLGDLIAEFEDTDEYTF